MAVPRGGRAVAQLLVLFLVAVLVGRLLLEPTGAGLVVLAFALPVLFAVLAAINGWRGALALLLVFLALAGLARVLFGASERAWVVLLLLPVVVATLAIAVSVVRQVWGPAAPPVQGGGPGNEAGRDEEKEGEAGP